MPLTNDNLSVWELAHRLSDSDPDKRYWLGLPLPVKDNIRLLLNEILSYRLTSILIMEKRRPDSESPPEYFIRTHLDEIYACIFGHSYPRQLLRFISVDRWDYWQWCQQSGQVPPAFWFSVEYQLAEDDEEGAESDEPDDLPDAAPPREKNRQVRELCRKLAREYWGVDSKLPIAQVARKIQGHGIADHFTEKSVVKWIRSIAPDGVRGRSGRPKKS